MKKELTPEREYSNAFDEAIEEDKQKRPEAYDKKIFTWGDYIAGRSELVEAKKKSVSVIGAKGGQRPKINRPILAALEQYLSENPMAIELQNITISKRFYKRLKTRPMEVRIDGQQFEVSFHCDKTTERDLIISTPCERYDGKTAKDTDKSITCSTFMARYIPSAKKAILNKKSQ